MNTLITDQKTRNPEDNSVNVATADKRGNLRRCQSVGWSVGASWIIPSGPQ